MTSESEPKAGHVLSLAELDPFVSRPAALSDRIYASLKHRILTGTMPPGSRVVEKELCDEMSVSRTPLREALNRLALEGLVTILPFRGFMVASLTVEDFRELCEVRRILEPEMAALCALRASDADITELERLADLHYSRLDPTTYEEYLRANSTFHQALVRATNNSRLEAMVVSALDQHQRPLYLGLGLGMDDGVASTNEHREIVRAIREHDAQAARDLMFQHISHGEMRIVTALHNGGY